MIRDGRQGDYDGAKRLYETALKIRKNALADDHPAIQQSRSDLAQLLYNQVGCRASLQLVLMPPVAQGKYEEAKSLYEQVNATLAPDHPDLVIGLSGLADVLRAQVGRLFGRLPDGRSLLGFAQGDTHGAKRLYERAIELAKGNFGSPKHLARSLSGLGELSKAQVCYLEPPSR